MKVVVAAVGAPRSKGLKAAIRDYETRIGRYFRFHTIDVKPERYTSGRDPADIVQKESEALLGRVPGELELVAVDRRGTQMTSEQLADYLGDLAVHGRPGAVFVIGGALGLSEALRARSQRILALSRFTLPHELARLVLVEQIYRAGTILRGEPYHKGA